MVSVVCRFSLDRETGEVTSHDRHLRALTPERSLSKLLLYREQWLGHNPLHLLTTIDGFVTNFEVAIDVGSPVEKTV
jgi:hypothetical protein